MNHLKVRNLFQNFFEKHNHKWLASSPLVPQQDPSLLFVNAGMNAFKNIFLSQEPSEHTNVASIQKCMRAGGKHNDLEQVGFSDYHHTFFEMMGNFSFGGYFKEKACWLAWEFLTQELDIPKKKLAVSVFKDDQETAQIWNQKLSIPKDRIFFFGEEDNFWRMGDEGPCGPCSEIYFDFNEQFKENSMFEVWNLVFMQYYENKNGKQAPLKNKGIDTGMGLERLCAVLEKLENPKQKISNYTTSLFQPILKQAETLIHTRSQSESSIQKTAVLRILADHIRAACFLIVEGILPSNEGRGYVLRRLLRRAIYQVNALTSDSVLTSTVHFIIDEYHSVYPELSAQKDYILQTLKQEEQTFLQTLEYGRSLLDKTLHDLKKKNISTLSAKTCFKLYDTYGFPFDLVNLICQTQNIKTDHVGFQKYMEESRLKSRKSARFSTQMKNAVYDEHTSFPKDFDPQKAGMFFISSDTPPSQFIGYDSLNSSSQLLALFDKNRKKVSQLSSLNDTAFAIFDQTCFYAEGGGQVGDQGFLSSSNSSSVKAVITDCQNIQGYYFHKLSLQQGIVKTGWSYDLAVSSKHRKETAVHHSATHLLHSALRKFLGKNTKQAGSLVTHKRLRFDFTSAVSLNEEQLQQLEASVNEQISTAVPVVVQHKPYEQALKDGALSFFDKPSVKNVRVLKIGDFSQELCGGTHVNNTSEIRYFKILSESAVGSGVRRIEAVCGQTALHLMDYLSQENLKARKQFHIPITDSYDKNFPLLECMEKQKNQIRELKKSKLVSDKTSSNVDFFVLNSQKVAFHCDIHPTNKHQFLSSLADQIKKNHPLAVVIAVGKSAEKEVPIVVALPKIISDKILSHTIIQKLGGRGGGPAHFAKGVVHQPISKNHLRSQVLELLKKQGFKEGVQ